MRFARFSLVFLLVACSPTKPPSNPPSVAEAFAAVDADDAQTLERYLNAGGNPNERSADGQTMLYVATGPHGGENVLRLLLARGAKPDIGFRKYTPLMNASSWCWLRGVQLLISAGADIHLRNEAGATALQTVCTGGGRDREQVIAYLHERGL